MVLQPLVENAVRHGGVSSTGHGKVSVTLRRADEPRRGMLMLRVQDDGPPPISPAREAGGGTGLSATAQRLSLLYGEAQTLHAGPIEGGGFVVTLNIPARQ
jgi:two-component system, LytTR family, sensor kinase